MAVYVIAVGFLMWLYWGELLRGDGLTRVYLLAAIFGTAAGGASVFALILEGGGRLVLSIPAAVKKIKDAGIEEGVEIGRDEGIEIGAERTRAEMGRRRAEARERFGRYDANGELVLPLNDKVERFLDGEDVGPSEPVKRRPFRRNRGNRRAR